MKSFAAFDIDGTLIRWQLYHAITDKLAHSGLIDKNDYLKLKDARMNWKTRQGPESFKEYENILIEIFESSLQNIPVDKFEKAVQQVINEYSNQVYTFTRDLIKYLKINGYVLIAISGSHEELVSQISHKFGFDLHIGTKYERLGNKFSGNKTLGSHNKQKSLKKIVEENKLSYQNSFAVGDSLGDAEMLELVENPIAFNPDQSLLEVAKSNGWKVVIERKNVIYELNKVENNYVLAETK